MAVFQKAISLEELGNGITKVVEINGKKILLANDDGNIHALSPYCTHGGAELDTDEVKDHAVHCSRHGAQFDVRDGAVVRMPAVYGLATYETRIEEGIILVGLDS